MIRPVEPAFAANRSTLGIHLLFHCRLKHRGRTLAVLSGEAHDQAEERAARLADVILPNEEGVSIEPA